MASFDRSRVDETHDGWIWRSLLWGLVGGGTCMYFWAMVWPSKPVQGSARARTWRGWLVVSLPSLYWLSFPLHFKSGHDFSDVLTGLIAAGLILAFGAWMVIRLIKAFEHSDEVETERLEAERASVQDNAGTPGI